MAKTDDHNTKLVKLSKKILQYCEVIFLFTEACLQGHERNSSANNALFTAFMPHKKEI